MAGAEIPNGWSALHWAAWRGDFHWLEQLLASAAAVDEKTIDGNTALFLAAYKGHKSIVQKLLIHKSDPSTACDLGEAPLHQSSYEGHTETIGLLIEAGADVNARSDNGTTPLHLAASNGQLASISLLLDAGASVFAIDEDGSTPGMIADENCYRDAAVILREQRSTFEKPDDETSSGQHIDFDPAMASIFPLEPASIRVHPHGYGCTGKSYALEALTECGREKFFMKTCRHSAVLEGELTSLQHLQALEPSFCPRPIGHGRLQYSRDYWLLTEWIDTRCSTTTPFGHRSFAEKLAHVHLAPQPSNAGSGEAAFGFHITTYHGPVPQDNSWKQSWAEFFAENKLRHVGRYIASKRDDAATRVLVCVLDHVADVVVPRLLGDGHLGGGSNIKPSLVHGDLWSGNKARGMIKSRCDKIEEYAFDAPCFYAHSEYDLAPMRMFGGFPTAFFTEYHLLVPKTEPVEEYDSRMELYQLYHRLTNYAVHGGCYREKAMTCMHRLLEDFGHSRTQYYDTQYVS